MTWAANGGAAVAAGSLKASPSDAFSRVQVLAPAIPSVMDLPWGAKGDLATVDTAAVQAAINAVSAVGMSKGMMIPLMLPPGHGFVLGEVVLASNVDLRAHGALIRRDPAYAADAPIFFSSPAFGVGTPVSKFALRGGTMVGTGAETGQQGFISMSQASDVTVEELQLSNVAAQPVVLGDSQWLHVRRNTLKSCATNVGGGNVINFVNSFEGNVTPLKHIWCDENYIDGTVALGVAIVSGANANRIDPVIDAHLTNNEITTIGAGWPIGVEQGGGAVPPNVSRIDISGNTLVQNGTGSYALALTNDSNPASDDPLCISDVTVWGNRLYAQGAGMSGLICLASLVSIGGNLIHAAADDIVLKGHGAAVIHHHTIAGNTGHLGNGKHVNVLAGVDTSTLTSVNTP